MTMHNIKRYANRKLYDTTDKKYITLDGIAELIKAGKKITVIDNKTGEDLTSGIISQIFSRDGQVKENDLASRVLIQLLRKGPGTLVDYGKKYVSLWDRALNMADEEIDKLVDRLVKEKEISESEGSALKKDMAGRASDLKKWIGEKIDQRVKEILDAMNLVSKDQVAGLTEEIRTLTVKMEKLEKAQARKAAEVKKAAALEKKKVQDLKSRLETVEESANRESSVVEIMQGSRAAEESAHNPVAAANAEAFEDREMVMGSEG